MNKEEQRRKIQDALLVYLGLSNADTQDWDEHAETVERADEELTYAEHTSAVEDREVINLDDMSVGDKILLLADDTLNHLLAGRLVLENSQELIATIQAVDMAIDVRGKGKNIHV